MSSSTRPRVVSAGVPIRSPDGFIGGRSSNGIALRLTVIPTCSSRSSAVLPSSPVGPRSTSTRCTSVPPVSTSTPFAISAVGERPRVGDRLALAGAEGLGLGDPERHGLGGDDVHQRAALLAGEDRAVDLLRELLVVGQDHPAARAAERLVDRGRGHVRVLDRVRVLAGGDQAGEVRHVDHQLRVDRVGDLAEGGEVELPRVGRPAGDDHLRPVLVRRAARPRPCRSGSPRGGRGRRRPRRACPRR